ncbi:hypothetical protein SUGI_0013360 [Cryptomeria japonica]|nr:hypothetical protein SUGI_0013360 [Cryptomeria japonica]
MMRNNKFTVSSPNSISLYLHRRKYERLRGRRKKIRVLRLRGQRNKAWKVRVLRKVRIICVSPKSFLQRFRDAYVNLLTKFSSKLLSFSGSSHGHLAHPYTNDVYEERVLAEMYKSMIAKGQLLPSSMPQTAV